ncbi:MAG: LysR family transcriptional regulator [Burkholderiaceae bacterium]|nr:LysR family transcriptional regulator [Burkholderiaceae bacterium]
MNFSRESLIAFQQTVLEGSFSAAARRLNKSQSTISTAIANLEIDLGVELFLRHGRHTTLTLAGERLVPYIEAIMRASDMLDDASARLSDTAEPRLTMVITDTWHLDDYESVLEKFSETFPLVELEVMLAENEDVVQLVQSGRAHVGIVAAQPRYPLEVRSRRLPFKSEMAVYVSQDHPLANSRVVTHAELNEFRQLYLQPASNKGQPTSMARRWSSSSLLILLDLAEKGFGWSILPRRLVNQSASGVLKELIVPDWPQIIDIDVISSGERLPGPAGGWMIDQLAV